MKFDIRPLSQKWFSESTPVNYATATAILLKGEDPTIKVVSSLVEETTKIAVVLAEDPSTDLSVTLANGKITVTLATTDAVELTGDDTKNTAVLIAAAIDALAGFTASAVGNGSDVINVTTTDVEFTDGTWATPCDEAYVGFESNGRFYVCTAPSRSKTHTNWKMFTLTSY